MFGANAGQGLQLTNAGRGLQPRSKRLNASITFKTLNLKDGVTNPVPLVRTGLQTPSRHRNPDRNVCMLPPVC